MPTKKYRKTFLPFFCCWILYLRSWIRDSGGEKIRIRDKNSGSATTLAEGIHTRPWCSECPRHAGGRDGCGGCATAVPHSRSKPLRNPAPVFKGENKI